MTNEMTIHVDRPSWGGGVAVGWDCFIWNQLTLPSLRWWWWKYMWMNMKMTVFNNQHRHRKCKVGICHGSDGFRSSCWSWSRHQSPTTQEGAAHAEGSSSSASTNYWWVVSCLMRTAPCYAIPTTTTTITNPTQHYNTKLYYFWVGAVQLSRRPKSTERWCTALETILLV